MNDIPRIIHIATSPFAMSPKTKTSIEMAKLARALIKFDNGTAVFSLPIGGVPAHFEHAMTPSRQVVFTDPQSPRVRIAILPPVNVGQDVRLREDAWVWTTRRVIDDIPHDLFSTIREPLYTPPKSDILPNVLKRAEGWSWVPAAVTPGWAIRHTVVVQTIDVLFDTGASEWLWRIEGLHFENKAFRRPSRS